MVIPELLRVCAEMVFGVVVDAPAVEQDTLSTLRTQLTESVTRFSLYASLVYS